MLPICTFCTASVGMSEKMEWNEFTANMATILVILHLNAKHFNISIFPQDAKSCQQSRQVPHQSWCHGRNTQGQQTTCWTFGWKTTHRLHLLWWPWQHPRLRGMFKVSDLELNIVSPSKYFSSTLWCVWTQKWPPQVRMETNNWLW